MSTLLVETRSENFDLSLNNVQVSLVSQQSWKTEKMFESF